MSHNCRSKSFPTNDNYCRKLFFFLFGWSWTRKPSQERKSFTGLASPPCCVTSLNFAHRFPGTWKTSISLSCQPSIKMQTPTPKWSLKKHGRNKWLCEIAAGVGITPALMLAVHSPDSEKQLKSTFGNPPPPNPRLSLWHSERYLPCKDLDI